jgi:transposase
VVGFNFTRVDREQAFLLPPDMRDWLPGDHLAWFVIEVVDQLDLAHFRRAYRSDGHGSAAYDPAVMVALLLYAYCTGHRSSRVIERRCREDVALRVVAGGLGPDHVTIARFRARHSAALATVLVASLRLCAEAGLVSLGMIAIDGTKIAANASPDANRTLEALQRRIEAILAEAEAVDAAEDAAEDAAAVAAGGGGLTDQVSREQRLARLRAAKARLQAEADQRAARFAQRARAINDRRAERGQAPLQVRPRPRDEAPQPNKTTNLTDPDSRILLGRAGRVQGYNAQAVATAEQIIVGAEVVDAANDVAQLHPMIAAATTTLRDAGVSGGPGGRCGRCRLLVQ